MAKADRSPVIFHSDPQKAERKKSNDNIHDKYIK